MLKHPLFIVFEGCEGAGKSTALKIVTEFFMSKFLPHIVTREPGGTKLGEQIRDIILQSSCHDKLSPDAELLLFFAARAQQVEKIIAPAISSGKHVLADRFTDSTYAYQGAGRGIAYEKISLLERMIQDDLSPDLVFIFDIEPALGLQRLSASRNYDYFENERLEFFTRVRNCYLHRAQLDPKRYQVIDASQAIQQVTQTIIDRISLELLSSV